MDQNKQAETEETTEVIAQKPEKKIYIKRFDSYSRILHLMVVTSFLTLALTGMVIKFSGVGIFQTVSKILGGYEVTGFLHRVAAIVTFAYFFLHIFYIVKKWFVDRKGFKYMMSGENSMLPRKQDLTDFIATIKWFLGLGNRPQYGRWTYWKSSTTSQYSGV